MNMNDIVPVVGRAFDAQAAHDAILMREREYKSEIEAVAKKLTPEEFASTKDAWADLNKADDQLKSLIKSVEAYARKTSGVDALLTQIKATRKNLAEIHDKNWEIYLALRDACKPAAPVHTYVIRVTCTDAAMGKICTAAAKSGGQDIAFATPQSDKDARAIQKWFEANI